MNDASAEASRSIRDYIKIINELEKLDEIITPPKYRRCCCNVLEVLKEIIKHFKIKSEECKWKKTTEDFILIRAVLIVILAGVVKRQYIKKLKQQRTEKVMS